MRKLDVPFSLLFVPAHGEHQSHRMIDAFDTAVGAGVVGAGGDLIDAQAFVDGAGTLRAEL